MSKATQQMGRYDAPYLHPHPLGIQLEGNAGAVEKNFIGPLVCCCAEHHESEYTHHFQVIRQMLSLL